MYATEDKLPNVFDRVGFAHNFVDEAHERRIAEYTLLMLCKEELLWRPAAFKLLLMTAQIDAVAIKTYFHNSMLNPWPPVSPYLATRTLVVRQVVVYGRRFDV